MLLPVPPRAKLNVPAQPIVCVLSEEVITTFVSLANIWTPVCALREVIDTAEAAIQIHGIDGSILQPLGQQRLVADHQKPNIIFLC